MKFVDRRSELALLDEGRRLGRRGLHGVLIYGPRRIGKTELVKRFASRRAHLYFFVTGYKTAEALLEDFERELRRAGWLSARESVSSWDDAIDVMVDRGRGRTVIFDEFQNFRGVHPAIFSILQKKIDSSRSSPLCVLYVGSIAGLMRDIFEGLKSPLYGRIQARMKVEPLAYEHVRRLVRGLGWKREADAVQLFALFGGYPKYYAAIEDFRLGGQPVAAVLERLYLSDHAIFASEVPDLLREEFGRRRGLYYTLLEAVATGHTKFSEIASFVHVVGSSVTRPLNELVEFHQLLERRAPAGESGPVRRSLYGVAHPVLRFWFKFIHRNLSLYESREFGVLRRIVRDELPAFTGREFERVCLELLRRMNHDGRLPARFDEIARWWRGDQEIDAVGLQRRKGGDLLAAEVKWSEGVDAAGLLSALHEKLRHVPIRRSREHYVFIAKSFSREASGALHITVRDFGRYFGTAR